MTDKEKLEILYKFLARVNGYGYLELSHDKVRDEYQYFHKRAKELMRELFPEKFPLEYYGLTQSANLDF